MSNHHRQIGRHSNDPVISLVLCQNCGASVAASDKRCWLCGNMLAKQNPFGAPLLSKSESRVKFTKPGSPAPADVNDRTLNGLFSVLLGLCLAVVLFLGLSIAFTASGLLIPYIVVVLPAFLVTGVRGISQFSNTGEVNSGKLILSFLLTTAVTMGVLVLIVGALILALFFICLSYAAN